MGTMRALERTLPPMRESGDRIPVPAVLRQVEIFRTLGEEEREAVAARMEVRGFRAGEPLFKEGDPSDGLYIVHSGEVGIVTEIGGEGRILARLGPGECFGEMSLLTGEPRSTSVYATLDSELLFLQDVAFDALLQSYPAVALAIGRTLSLRLRRANRATREDPRDRILLCVSLTEGVDALGFATGLSAALAACRTREVLLVGLGGRPPETPLAAKGPEDLQRAIRRGESPDLAEYTGALEGDVRLLALAEPAEELDPRLLGRLLGVAVGQFGGVVVAANLRREDLESGEAKLRVAVEQAFRQSDAPILLVDLGQTALRAARSFLARPLTTEGEMGPAWRIALIRPPDLQPGAVREAEEMIGRTVTYQVVRDDAASCHRLARRLSHAAVGLALGGGGARGLAHIGILEVLGKEGIPIDVIGGTSIGSIISSLHVTGQTPEQARETVRREWVDRNPLSDYTLPKAAVIRGRNAERVLRRVLGETQIEDLPLPYFAVAADLVTAEEVVLSRGPLWRAVRASGSIPVLITPVRVDDHFLVDGGVINNVPGDHLGRFGADLSIAVDVTPRRDQYFQGLLRKPERTGLLGRLARRSGRIEEWLDYPGIFRTLWRILDIEALEIMKTKSAAFDVCIQPKLEGFDLLDFSKLDRLVEEGRKAAEGALPAIRQRMAGMGEGEAEPEPVRRR